MIRIILVDDHPVVLDGLESALSRMPDLRVVARARSLGDARAAINAYDVDLVLVDIRLRDGSGLEFIAEQSRSRRSPAWLVLSSFESDQYLAAALSVGASGYLLKTADTEEIAASIRSAVAGRATYTSAQLARAMRGRRPPLSRTDHLILEHLLEGMSNDEIGSALGLAERTVEAHLSTLYSRAGVGNRLELALLAQREAWLDDPIPD